MFSDLVYKNYIDVVISQKFLDLIDFQFGRLYA